MAKKLLLVRVGNDVRPATQADIDQMKAEVEPLFKDTDVDVLVTHHAVQVDVVDFYDDSF